MVYIVREVAKIILFGLIWGSPLYLVSMSENYNYLWFWVVSLFVTILVFTHYEDLEKIDSKKEQQEEGEQS